MPFDPKEFSMSLGSPAQDVEFDGADGPPDWVVTSVKKKKKGYNATAWVFSPQPEKDSVAPPASTLTYTAPATGGVAAGDVLSVTVMCGTNEHVLTVTMIP